MEIFIILLITLSLAFTVWLIDSRMQRNVDKSSHVLYAFITIIMGTLLILMHGFLIIIVLNPKDEVSYQRGYKDALNTKFEQRIDTVYIKKK